MPATERYSRKWLWLTLVATAVIALIVQVPLLLKPELVDEDLRFFYWLHRLKDSSLFAADPLLGYQIGELHLGATTLLYNKTVLLYGMLYSVLSRFMTPFTFSKLLMLPLALTASYYLYRLGERLADEFTAFVLSLTFTLIAIIPYSDLTYASGLPRAFALPLLLAALYYMSTENTLGMALVLVLAMLYPPAFATILLTYGTKYAFESVRQRRLALNGRQRAPLLVALMVTILLLLPALLTGLNQVPVDNQGQQASTLFNSPLYGEDGRYPLLNSTLNANGGIFDFGPIGLYSMLLLLLLIPTALVLGRRFNRLTPPYWYLVLGSLVGFVLSWLAILFTPSAILHMPSRYMQGTVFIVSLTLVAVNAPVAFRVAARRLVSNRRKLDWLLVALGLSGFGLALVSSATASLKVTIGLLFVLIVALVLIGRRRSQSPAAFDGDPTAEVETGSNSEPESSSVQTVIVFTILILPLIIFLQLPDRLHRLPTESEELVGFTKALPQDVLIAGYPCLLDDIPLYAQRTILFSCEVESRDMALMLSALDAYFATEEAEVLGFCQQYGVDYLVVSPWTFTEAFREQERIMFEPFDSYLKTRLAGNSNFILERVPKSKMLFQNDSFFLIPCSTESLSAAS